MRVKTLMLAQSVLGHVPTALVLAALGVVGYLGATNGWTVPKFSALFSRPEEPEKGPAIEVIADPAAEQSTDACTREFQNKKLKFPSADAARKAGLAWARVETRSMARHVTANGVIDYDQTLIAHLTSPVQGIAWRIDKHLGDPVKKGDVLALVDSVEVGKAKAEFQQYLIIADIKRKIVRQMSKESSPPVKIEEAEAALREATIRLQNAQQTLINLGLPVRLKDFEGLSEPQLVEKVRVLGLPEATVRTLDRERTSGNLIPLLAPFDGLVVGRDIVKGEIVGTNPVHFTPQFTVADTRHMWILLDVRQEDTGQLAKGQEVVFTADGMPGVTAVGKVGWVSTEVEEKTRTVRVRADADNPDGKLRAHLFGTGRILVASLPQAVAVPDDAVQADVQGDAHCRMVFVRLDDETFQARLVQTGERGDGYTQILKGVAAGEEVVTTGGHALKSEIVKGRIAAGD